MAQVTNDLIYEVLKKMQVDIAALRTDMRSVREELIAMRQHQVAMQRDISNNL